MIADRKLGAAIALVTPIVAVLGVILAVSKIQPALGGVMIGIVLGTAVARGYFAVKPKGCK